MDSDKTPLISIVIPTYNRADYLDEAIQSARTQTYEHLDIVILDDASPDHTPDMVRAHQVQDARVRYVRHDENKGLVPNWRYGIEVAKGEFFVILGDDDTMEPRCIEKLLHPLLEDDSLVLSFCDHWIMDEEGTRMEQKSKVNTKTWRRETLPEGKVEDLAHVALVNRSLFIGSILFRRSAVDASFIEDEVKAFVDLWILYGCCLKGPGYYVSDRLVTCRWQTGSVSRSWEWRSYGYQGEIYYYRILLADERLGEYHDIFSVRLAEALVGLGSTYLLLGEREKSRALFQEALDMYPSLRGRLGYILSFGGPLSTMCLSTLRRLRNYFLPPSRPPIYPEENVPELMRSTKNKPSKELESVSV